MSAPIATALDAAIALGIPAFPCRANKRPACPHGHKDAETKQHKIESVQIGARRLILIGSYLRLIERTKVVTGP